MKVIVSKGELLRVIILNEIVAFFPDCFFSSSISIEKQVEALKMVVVDCDEPRAAVIAKRDHV